MILSFAQKTLPEFYQEEPRPRLLTASNISRESSQYARVLHSHSDRLEILLVRTGSGYYIVDQERFDIKAGTVIICNEGSLHDEVPEYNHQLSMFCIALDQVHIRGLPRNHLIPATLKPVIEIQRDFSLLESIFRSIFEALSCGDELAQDSSFYLAQALLALIQQLFHRYGCPTTPPPRKESFSLLSDIKGYIDQHYKEDLSLATISDQFFVSQSYLSHLFKSRLGYTPMHYISRRRIGEAQLMLVFTDKTITEIACEVGFNSLSHFNVQFKKYVGLSPVVYRNKNLT